MGFLIKNYNWHNDKWHLVFLHWRSFSSNINSWFSECNTRNCQWQSSLPAHILCLTYFINIWPTGALSTKNSHYIIIKPGCLLQKICSIFFAAQDGVPKYSHSDTFLILIFARGGFSGQCEWDKAESWSYMGFWSVSWSGICQLLWIMMRSRTPAKEWALFIVWASERSGVKDSARIFQ